MGIYSEGMQDSHEVLEEAIDAVGPKVVAAELGVSLSIIYKWMQAVGEDQSGTRNPLDRVSKLIQLTEHPGIIQWLCHRAGGFYVEDPNGVGVCQELIPATTEIIQEFADMMSVIAAAAADGQISEEESRDVRRRWAELKTVTEGFVRCCEQGHFGPLREATRKPLSAIGGDLC